MRSAMLLAGLALLAACHGEAPRKSATTPDIHKVAAGLAQKSSAPPAAQPSPSAQPSPPPTLVDTFTKKFTALGTEPFWSFVVQPGQLRYSSLDQPDGAVLVATATRSGSSYRYAATMRSAAVTLLIAPGPCSDGMSDAVYAYTATATIGPQVLHGCAKLD